jgi:hypothetical protein
MSSKLGAISARGEAADAHREVRFELRHQRVEEPVRDEAPARRALDDARDHLRARRHLGEEANITAVRDDLELPAAAHRDRHCTGYAPMGDHAIGGDAAELQPGLGDPRCCFDRPERLLAHARRDAGPSESSAGGRANDAHVVAGAFDRPNLGFDEMS